MKLFLTFHVDIDMRLSRLIGLMAFGLAACSEPEATEASTPQPPLDAPVDAIVAVKRDRDELIQRTEKWREAHWAPMGDDVHKLSPEGERELAALCDAWESLVGRVQDMDLTRDQAKSLIPGIKMEWLRAREHRDEIYRVRKERRPK